MCVGQGWPAAGYGAKTIAEVINNPSHVNSIPVSTEAIGDRLAVRISGTESLTADVVSLVADATGIGGGPGSTIAIGWPQLPHLMRFPTYLLSVRYRFWHWLQTTSIMFVPHNLTAQNALFIIPTAIFFGYGLPDPQNYIGRDRGSGQGLTVL